MAAVARNIDDFVAIVRQLAYTLCIMNVNPLIQTVPGKAQNTVRQTNHFVGEVGGNLFHQRNGILLRFFVGDFFTARFIFYRARDSF